MRSVLIVNIDNYKVIDFASIWMVVVIVQMSQKYANKGQVYNILLLV